MIIRPQAEYIRCRRVYVLYGIGSPGAYVRCVLCQEPGWSLVNSERGMQCCCGVRAVTPDLIASAAHHHLGLSQGYLGLW